MGSSPLITVCMKTIITVIFFRLFRFGQKWRRGKNWNIHNIAGFWLKHNDQSLKKDFRLTYLTLVRNSPFIQHLIELILSLIHFHLKKKRVIQHHQHHFFYCIIDAKTNLSSISWWRHSLKHTESPSTGFIFQYPGYLVWESWSQLADAEDDSSLILR